MAKSKKPAATGGGSRPASIKAPILLLVTVVLCLPIVRVVLAGQMPASSAAIRTGIAVLVAWTAVAGIGNLVEGYRRHNASRPATAEPTEETGRVG